MIPAISESIMTDVQSYRKVENIAYREGPELEDYARERCRLDIYFPEGAADFATVVWFHGGGMTAGEKYVPGELMNQGIAVVAAEYRLSPHVNAPAYIEDAAAAVAWVFKNIEQYGGSTQRVFVAGASAGGYLATMVGLDNQYLAAHGMDANRIAGLISLSGQAITHFTVRAERGISGTQPMVDELAPLFHVRGDAPPLLLVTGDRDLELFGRYEENAYFQRMMKVVGHADNELHELKGRDHGGVEAPAHSLLLEFLKRINKTISTAGETK
ncbi:MAG: alpha/beta hydrolase [Verrucomicrobia bacterium]|nr:alpha/beta hydrolase [Verrucomicrobiota bacterium]